MAKFALSQMQKYAIVLIVAAAALLFVLPLLMQPAQPLEDRQVAPEVFFSSLENAPSIAIIANISAARTDAARTAILQCSVDLRSNIIAASGKNTIYVACEGTNCLYSGSNEGNGTLSINPSQISGLVGPMPQFYISYGMPVSPAYYAKRAHFWVNDTLVFPCSVFEMGQNSGTIPTETSNETNTNNAVSNETTSSETALNETAANNTNETAPLDETVANETSGN